MVSSTLMPATSAPATAADIQTFKSVILDMDSMSQGGFSKISSIARLALAALETPGPARRDEDIANALTAIWHIADDVENCINCRAEDVGSNYIDNKLSRRRAAGTPTAAVEGVTP